MHHMQITIVRFGLYPEDAPTGYVVGFNVTHQTRTRYADTIVSLDAASGKTDEEIVALAWNALDAQFSQWKQSIDARPVFLNTTFVPPGQEEEEVDPPAEEEPPADPPADP